MAGGRVASLRQYQTSLLEKGWPNRHKAQEKILSLGWNRVTPSSATYPWLKGRWMRKLILIIREWIEHQQIITLCSSSQDTNAATEGTSIALDWLIL